MKSLYCLDTLFSLFFAGANMEEIAIAAYWVLTDGVDRCRVGFLPRHCVRQTRMFDGRLAQVVCMPSLLTTFATLMSAHSQLFLPKNKAWLVAMAG
jgi:hypothetical protein